MLGYKLEELVGTSMMSLFGESSQERVKNVLTSMSSATGSYGESFEVEAKRKNATFFPAHVSMSVSLFEKTNLVSVFIKDITSEKKHNTLIEEERKKSDTLLLNILPEQVAMRVRCNYLILTEVVESRRNLHCRKDGRYHLSFL